MPKYQSKKFLELFNTFRRMFDEEGDVYNSIKESIVNEYEHDMLPSNIEKRVMLSILKDAAIDFHKENMEILTEKEYLNQV